jgi:hypothetical protein
MLIDSIILGRFVSSLRALLQADDQYEYEDHPARSRARVNGFILSAGILNEALTFTNYLAGKYKDLPEWTSGFGPMLKTVPQWFREYVRAVRNRGAFHYDDRSEIATRSIGCGGKMRTTTSKSHLFKWLLQSPEQRHELQKARYLLIAR